MDSKKTTKGSVDQIAPTRKLSKRLTEDELLNTVGATGTYIVNGFLEQDYNSKLNGEAGLRLYDEMRKSDAQIRASLMVCKLPILSTEWYVEPAKNQETGEVGEAEQEVADMVAKALFEKMEIPWQSYLIEVMTSLEFGFSVFEKVYTADDSDDHIWLKKLAYRKQTTVQKWEMESGEAGITQALPQMITDPDHPNVGKNRVSIPASKLLLFSYQREGDNYAGVSILRSAYKHWYIKDALYKFDTIKHERQGVGIPVIQLPKGHSAKDKAEARAILKNIRANEQGGVILPREDWKFMFADLQAGNTSDIWKSIDHHNGMLAKNVLAMFMELASGDGGSRALSEDQSDFFLLAQESYANLIEDVHNRHLIPELVDLNFEVQDYPKLRHKKLGSVDYSSMAGTLSTLIGSGAMKADETLEDWIRKMIDAPPRMQEEEEEEIDEEIEDEIDPETGEPIIPEDEPLDDVDPETGLPIEPIETLDENGDPIEEVEVDENGDPIQAHEVQLYAFGENTIMFNNVEGEWYEEDGETYRIVSEETKRKISESLKKARGRMGGAKPVSKIAQVRGKRLAKAGIKDSAARQQKVISQAQSVPVKKRTKLGQALTKIKMQKKGGAKAKKSKTAKKPKTAKVKKTVKKTSLQQNVARRKAVRIAAKKKVKASEPDPYLAIFSEGAEYIRSIQSAVDFEKGELPQGPQRFSENTYDSWRPQTFAEQKVNWKSLNKTVKKFESALQSEVQSITADQKADLLEQVKRAVEKNNIVAVGTLRAKYTGDLSSALTNVQKEMFEAGKSSVALEMGVKAPSTAKEVMGAMKVSNAKLVQKLNSDMENAAADAVSQVIIKKGGAISSTGTTEAVNAASEAIDRVLESTNKINTLTLYGSLNLGRAAIFERYPEKVYAFQYSAIIDDRTTDTCLSLDGRVVKAGSSDFYSYNPPLHYNCRSIWVEILEDEEFKPETDDIPSRISTNATIDGFKDIKAPIVQENSPAIKLIKAEIAERQAKVKDYQDAGTFPARIASHQARINDLEDALADNVSLGSIDITEKQRVDKGGK